MRLRQKYDKPNFSPNNNGFVGGLTFIPGGLDEKMQVEVNSLLEKITQYVEAGESYDRISMLLAPEVFSWRTSVLNYVQNYRKDILAETEHPLKFLKSIQENDEQAAEIFLLFERAIQLEKDIIQQVALNQQKSVIDVLREGIIENTAENYRAYIYHINTHYKPFQAAFLERLLHSSLAVQVASHLVYLVYKKNIELNNDARERLVEFVSDQLSILLGCEMFALNMDALVSYRSLQTNWDGDGAEAPTEAAIMVGSHWLSEANLGEIALAGGRVNTFPTRNGGIQIDIDCLENPLEIEISPEGKAELLQYNQDLDIVNRTPLQHLPF
jgi:hypothetical protein